MPYILNKYGPSATAMIKNLKQVGNTLGINFREDRLVVPTLKSHCLVDYASKFGQEKQNKVIEVIFSLYFEQSKNINDIDTLSNAAEELGITGAREYLTAHQNESDVIKEAEAYRKQFRVTGVPFFIFTKEGTSKKVVFSGAQPKEVFEDAINEVAEGK